MITVTIRKRDNTILVKQKLEGRLGFKLFLCASKAAAWLRKELNIPYPPASVPGQFPRKRTGRLRNSVMIWPQSVAAITKARSVSVRYDKEGFYGNILVKKGRLGPATILMRQKKEYDRIMQSK